MTDIYNKMNRFFEQEIRSDVRNILITQDKAGTISLFGKYVIAHANNGLYKVSRENKTSWFGELQNALAYVILTNEGQDRQATRIEFLDNALASINFDITVHRRMLKKKVENKSFYITQIQEKTIKKKTTVNELKSYISLCKKLQEDKFNNSNKPKFRRVR